MKTIIEFDETDSVADIRTRVRACAMRAGLESLGVVEAERLLSGFHSELVQAVSSGNQIRLEKELKGPAGVVAIRAVSRAQRSIFRRLFLMFSR